MAEPQTPRPGSLHLDAAAALSHLPITLRVIDANYRLIYTNQTWNNGQIIWSLPPAQADESILLKIDDATRRAIWQHCCDRALDGESCITTIAESSFHFLPISDVQGQPYVLVIETASPPPQAQRDIDDQHRVAIEAIPEPFSLCEVIRNQRGQIVDARIVAVNTAMCRLTDYSYQDLSGQRLLDLFPNFAEDGVFGELRRVVETGTPLRRQATITTQSGELRIIELCVVQIGDGFTGIWRDITAQVQRDQQWRQQAQLFDHIVDAVIGTDLNYVITSWNRGAELIYGWSASETIGHRLGEFLRTHFSETTAEEAMDTLLQTGRWEGEVEQNRRDNTLVPIHSVVVLVRDEKGAPTGIVAVNRDMSERRHFEQLLMKVNQRLEEAMIEAQRQANEVLLVNELHDLLQVCQTRSEAANVIAFSLQRIFPRQIGYVLVRQTGSASLNLLAAWGDCAPTSDPITIDQCWALRRGLLHRACPEENLRCAHIPPAYEDCTCCVPLVVQGDIYGLLHIAGRDLPRSELIVMTGDAIKLALSNLDLRAMLREQAIIDPLTSLYNRRYLETTLPRELHRAQRERSPLTVAMVDIDYFKQFNDQYGHDAGDTLLRELATIFREHMRQSDLICRYGGEEFVLIMPGINSVTAQQRLQQLKETVQHRPITFAGQLLKPVTISIGYTICMPDEDNARHALQRADAALYAAKRSGRNRVVRFSEDIPLPDEQRHE
ncbi:sensor domain-containing diguanylate cyclase [Chloroflexus sp.]|uniref:sensor domain-containing diguanylate cyclase n=1 Tax=Chloroflexus sp. TaxID=1904827 RepID=UPI00260643E4|nr:diguanylate cyclase [uncultured Chloroflexus sp.]